MPGPVREEYNDFIRAENSKDKGGGEGGGGGGGNNFTKDIGGGGGGGFGGLRGKRRLKDL